MDVIPLPSMPDERGHTDAEAGAPDAVELVAVWAARIRDGDERAFEAFFRTRREGLLAAATRLLGGDRAAAHDVVQESFVRLWEGRDRIDPERSLDGLLSRTVRNLALNRLRDAKTRGDLLEERAGEVPTPRFGRARPDEALARNDLERQLSRWIEALPDRQREALSLTRFHGYDHAEAASLMGCAPRTVNNHLVRALGTLRDRLAEYAPDLWQT